MLVKQQTHSLCKLCYYITIYCGNQLSVQIKDLHHPVAALFSLGFNKEYTLFVAMISELIFHKIKTRSHGMRTLQRNSMIDLF